MRVAYFTESPVLPDRRRGQDLPGWPRPLPKVECRFFSPCLPQEEEPWRWRVQKVPSFAFPLYRYYRVAWPSPKKIRQELDAFRPDLVQVAPASPSPSWARTTPWPEACPASLPTTPISSIISPTTTWAPCRAWAGPFCAGSITRGLRALTAGRSSGVLGLYVGRLVKDKDLDVLARALKNLPAQPEAAPPRGRATAFALASADVFTFPSTNETFGNVVLEAFSSP